MALEKWQKIGDQLVAKNPFWEYRQAKFTVPSGKSVDYFYVHHNGGVTIVGVNNSGQVALVKQYRPLVDRVTFEFPAGGIEEGDAVQESAAREFSEETKFGAKVLDDAGYFYSSYGTTDQKAYVFVASDLYSDPKDGDENEDIEVVWVSPEQLEDMIADQTISDGWTISSWALARRRVLEIIAALK